MPDSAWGYSLPRIFTEREAKQSRCAEAMRRIAALERGGALVGIVREKDERIAELKDRLSALERENERLRAVLETIRYTGHRRDAAIAREALDA